MKQKTQEGGAASAAGGAGTVTPVKSKEAAVLPSGRKVDTQPGTLSPQPSTLELTTHPSPLTPQPLTLNPQPSTLNPQPSTEGGAQDARGPAGG
jgi:hypothetical protein